MQKINMTQSSGEIKSINQRAEKHGNEKKIAVDIDILTEVHIEFIKQMSIGDVDCNYEDMFYDEKGNVKTLGLKKIEFDREYKNHTAVITLDDLNNSNIKLTDIKIKKFFVIPVYGKRISLSLQIQCMPSDDELVFLAHAHTKNNILIEIIESDQKEMFDEN